MNETLLTNPADHSSALHSASIALHTALSMALLVGGRGSAGADSINIACIRVLACVLFQ